MNPLRVTQPPKSNRLEAPTGRRGIAKLRQCVVLKIVQRKCVEFCDRIPKRVDFSVTSKEAGSGDNQTNVSESVDLAKDGSGMTPLRMKGPRKIKSDEKFDRPAKPAFRE